MTLQDHWNKVGEGEVERVWELCGMVSVNIITNKLLLSIRMVIISHNPILFIITSQHILGSSNIVLYCIVLYCIMRPYTDGPIGPLSYRHSSGVVRNPHSTLAE